MDKFCGHLGRAERKPDRKVKTCVPGLDFAGMAFYRIFEIIKILSVGFLVMRISFIICLEKYPGVLWDRQILLMVSSSSWHLY